MSSQVKILSYNILDVELESNFVPRNMHTSCKEAIFAAAGITEKDKKKLRDGNKIFLTKLNAEKVLMFNEKNELVYASYEDE